MALASLGWKVGVGGGRGAGFRTAGMGAPGPGWVGSGAHDSLRKTRLAGMGQPHNVRESDSFFRSTSAASVGGAIQKKTSEHKRELGHVGGAFWKLGQPARGEPSYGRKIDRRSSSLNERMVSGVGKPF